MNVRLSSYISIAQHWHVVITEQENPLWDSRDAWGQPEEPTGWRLTFDDLDRHGKSFHSTFRHKYEAMAYILETIEKHFPDETHEAFINCVEMFEYMREGD